ncbi:MAG: hypothetical protein QNK37_08890 [Acidobacteriota bacterium]|nr:hypothetical protein [Acidobacteriota bacterium]
MEKLDMNLFDDTNVTADGSRAAGKCGGTICATAVGGSVTQCATRLGCNPSDALLDIGA